MTDSARRGQDENQTRLVTSTSDTCRLTDTMCLIAPTEWIPAIRSVLRLNSAPYLAEPGTRDGKFRSVFGRARNAWWKIPLHIWQSQKRCLMIVWAKGIRLRHLLSASEYRLLALRLKTVGSLNFNSSRWIHSQFTPSLIIREKSFALIRMLGASECRPYLDQPLWHDV